ncbi:MAG: glycosyltransferase family 87 protein [Polyangiaceae bacterium]
MGALVISQGGPLRFFEQLDPRNASHVCFDVNSHEPRVFCDFANVYYPQGESLRQSADAVRGFYYSPFFGVCMRAIAVLPFAFARAVWFAIVLSATAVVVCLPSLLELAKPHASVASTLVLATSLPLLHDLIYGQVSSILLALIALSFVAYRRERRLLSAVLLGLATAIKFYPALFALFYLARRDLRSTLYFTGTVFSCVVLIPWLFLGSHGYLTFVASIAQNLEELRRYLEHTPYSNAAVTVLSSAGRRWLKLGELANPSALLLAACIAFALLGLLVRSARRNDPLSALLLGASALPFVVRSCWVHYFVFLPLLQSYVLLASREKDGSPALRWCGLVGPVISVTLLSYPYFRLFGDADSYYRAGFPFWATVAVLPGLFLTQFSQPSAGRGSNNDACVPRP